MPKGWIVFLSLITAIVLIAIGVFIGAQFKEPDYQPRFRLTEESDTARSNSKEVMEMKSNLMSSIAKNCRGNLKGPIPSSLEFDLSKTTDEGAKSLFKVFDVSLIEISTLKGYTYVLKETLPISKYTYHDEVQSGLLTNVPMEALLSYFKHDKTNKRPVMVCAVVSIDEKDFDCYLRDSQNKWSTFEGINELNPTDPEFDMKVNELINNHYNKLSSPKESMTKESESQDEEGGIEEESKQDDDKTDESKQDESGSEPPKQDMKDIGTLELDLSKKEGFNNELVEVSELSKLKIPGFKGFAHSFNRKLSITKFEYADTELEGLPTDTPLDAVLTYFQEDRPYNDPFVICTVTSARGRKFDCYLRDSDNNWSKNDKISELNHRDADFGQKFAEIVKDHYKPYEPSYEKYSWDPELSYDPYQSSTNLPSEDKSETKSEDGSQGFSSYTEGVESESQDEKDSSELKVEQTRVELDQKEELSQTDDKTEESNPDDNEIRDTSEDDNTEESKQDENEMTKPDENTEESQKQDENEIQVPDENTEESQNQDQNEIQVPENLEVDLSDKQNEDGFTKISKLKELEVPGYMGYSHIFNEQAKVNNYKYKGQKQYGLPSNTNLDGVLVYFKQDKLDEIPLAVCTLKSIDEMDFDCYLRDSENNWSKNVQLSELDVTSNDFGVKASRLVDQHYNPNK